MSFPLTVTEKAQKKFKELLRSCPEEGVLGLRVALKKKGCSGMSYAIEYAKEKEPFDETLNFENFFLFVDRRAVLHLFGTKIDYEETPLKSGFVFQNPNEKGRCGCGESFHI